jgi:hypothetical protein
MTDRDIVNALNRIAAALEQIAANTPALPARGDYSTTMSQAEWDEYVRGFVRQAKP